MLISGVIIVGLSIGSSLIVRGTYLTQSQMLLISAPHIDNVLDIASLTRGALASFKELILSMRGDKDFGGSLEGQQGDLDVGFTSLAH
jgi:hypothetical protein